MQCTVTQLCVVPIAYWPLCRDQQRECEQKVRQLDYERRLNDTDLENCISAGKKCVHCKFIVCIAQYDKVSNAAHHRCQSVTAASCVRRTNDEFSLYVRVRKLLDAPTHDATRQL